MGPFGAPSLVKDTILGFYLLCIFKATINITYRNTFEDVIYSDRTICNIWSNIKQIIFVIVSRNNKRLWKQSLKKLIR